MNDELQEAILHHDLCLTALEPAGSAERPHWFCPSCSVAVLVKP